MNSSVHLKYGKPDYCINQTGFRIGAKIAKDEATSLLQNENTDCTYPLVYFAHPLLAACDRGHFSLSPGLAAPATLSYYWVYIGCCIPSHQSNLSSSLQNFEIGVIQFYQRKSAWYDTSNNQSLNLIPTEASGENPTYPPEPTSTKGFISMLKESGISERIAFLVYRNPLNYRSTPL